MDARAKQERLIERLRAPVPWRPALQTGDAGYPISKAALRSLIRRAEGTGAR